MAAGGRTTEIDPDWPGACPAGLVLLGWMDCFYLYGRQRTPVLFMVFWCVTSGNATVKRCVKSSAILFLRDSGRASGGGLDTDAVNCNFNFMC